GLGDLRLVSGLDGHDRAAAILHVVHHGPAGVLGARSLDLHLHPFCFRIHRRRTFVSVEHPAAAARPRAPVHTVPVSDVLPGQYLLGTTHRPGIVGGSGHSGVLGHGGLRAGAVDLEPGHTEVLGRGRMTMPADLPPSTPSALQGLRRYLTIYAALWKNSVVREMGFKANFLLWIV